MTDIKRLPDAELQVMQAVWSLEPPVSRVDIEAIIHETNPLAPTTILTLLSRLVDRGFLKTEKAGRTNHYTPLIDRQDYVTSQSRSFWEKLCGGDMQVFATALNDSGISQEDLAELRELLEKESL